MSVNLFESVRLTANLALFKHMYSQYRRDRDEDEMSRERVLRNALVSCPLANEKYEGTRSPARG